MVVGNVVALVDGSVYSRSVCDHAAWLALRLAAPVEVVHVTGRAPAAVRPDCCLSLGGEARRAHATRIEARDIGGETLAEVVGKAILGEAADQLRAAGVAEVRQKLRSGDLVDTLHEMEVDARVVVIGKRGEGADFSRLTLGSNLERAVRAARVKILVASRAMKPIRQVAIAHDGGPSSQRAMEMIARDPMFTGLRLHLLTVSSDAAAAQAMLDAAAVRLEWPGDVVTHVGSGEADAVIADYVANSDIDLLVMGAYGHSRVRNLIVGSTTSQMIRSCPVPILVVR